MKIWAKTKEYWEGKFLVIRRDGSIPFWKHFVIGARDPIGALALKAYADIAEKHGYDKEYCDSIRELAQDFVEYRAKYGDGDPISGPHRKDDPLVIRAMRGEEVVLLVKPDPDPELVEKKRKHKEEQK